MKNQLVWTSPPLATTLSLENRGWINMIQLFDGKILLSHSLPHTVKETVHTTVKQSLFTRGHRLQFTAPVLSSPSPPPIPLLCNRNRSINVLRILCRTTLREYPNPVLNLIPILNPNLVLSPNPALSPAASPNSKSSSMSKSPREAPQLSLIRPAAFACALKQPAAHYSSCHSPRSHNSHPQTFRNRHPIQISVKSLLSTTNSQKSSARRNLTSCPSIAHMTTEFN
jgi:hypothetical protein